jgi:RimJ/RimL family protein N-acetyltransferase
MLAGPRVTLRRLESADLERCHNWLNIPEIFIVMGVFAPRTMEDQQAWFASTSTSRKNLVFAVCERASGRHIGNVSLFNLDWINRNAGLTIFIADPADRGGGRGSEALSLLCEYAFNYLNLHKVYCKTNAPAAARMYQRLGFMNEGVLREQNFHRGEYIDKWQYGLLAHEFRPCHELARNPQEPE